MRRFYRLDIEADLFGGVLLMKQGGASARGAASQPTATNTPLSKTDSKRIISLLG